jgi:hypothetical protein
MGRRTITPLGAVVGGLLAGAVGTACMDTLRYLRYRRGQLTWPAMARAHTRASVCVVSTSTS